MMPKNMPPVTMITEPDALRKLVDLLLRQPIVAVDTESNSLHAYKEQVCLIQFSTVDEDFLVDPLALKDLSPLGELFAEPNVEKVFHAAEYDLICMTRDFGFKFDNLFDTMVAGTILGREEIGLGAMLENELGIEVDKRFQRADWAQRPLPKQLIDYARLDTHFLINLRDRLKAELELEDRWPLAAEDFVRLRLIGERIAENLGKHKNGAEEACWRIDGSHDLPPQQAAVLMELCKYRDQAAKSQNRPLFKVINDSTLLAIAEACPLDVHDLRGLPGMSPGQVERHGRGLIQAVKRGLEKPPLHLARRARPDEQFTARLDHLRRWRKNMAQHMRVKSDVILPRDLMNVIAEQDPKDLEDLGKILEELPWRFEHFGEQILGVLRR